MLLTHPEFGMVNQNVLPRSYSKFYSPVGDFFPFNLPNCTFREAARGLGKSKGCSAYCAI